jgi:hypothetical protein
LFRVGRSVVLSCSIDLSPCFARIISLFARAGNCRSDWRNINGLLAQDASQNRLQNGFS